MWPWSLFSDPTWRPLAATLLHFLWEGMVLAAAWMLLFRLFRGRSTQVQYVLGLAGLLALTACPIATFATLNSDTSSERAWSLPSPFGRGAGGEGDALSPKHPYPSPLPRGEGTAWQDVVRHWADAFQPYLLGGWLLGLAVFGGRLALGAVGARRLRRGRRPVPAALAARAAALAWRLGLKTVPGVFVSDVVREGVVTGLLRPMILLPAAWLLEMTPEVLEAVIAHELAHVRRFDLWVNLFQRLVETVLFYHPAVWWLSHRVRLLREMCCDEMAVAATGQPVVYATALELAAQRRLAPARPFLEVALGATQMTLLDRVRNVLGLSTTERKGRWWRTMLWTILGILVVGVVIVAGGRQRYTAHYFLRVAMQEKPIAFPVEPQVVDRDRFEIYKATQEQLVQSRFVLLAALRKPQVCKLASVQEAQKAGDAVRWLTRRLSVSFPGKAEIMEVSVSGNDPQEATVLVNAVVEAYLNEVVNAERDQKRKRLMELDRAYVEKEMEIRSKREDLKNLAEALGTSDSEGLSVKQKLALEMLAIYRQEVAKAQFELRRFRGELTAQKALLKNLDAAKIGDDEVEAAVQADPIARQLFTELGWRKLDKAHREQPPEAQPEAAARLEKDLKTMQEQYDARRAELREVVRQKKRAAIRDEIQRLEAAIALMTEQRNESEKEAEQVRKQAERFGTSTVDIEMMRTEIKNLEVVLTALAQEREKFRVEVRATPRITAPFGRADVPEFPNWW